MTDQQPPPPPYGGQPQYGGPPQYGQQPPARKGGGCGKAALIGLAVIGALVLVLVVIIVAAIAGDDDEDTATGTTTAEEGEPPQSEGEADELDDATITECSVDASTDWMVARVEVTNNSSERSDYLMDVVFESPGGGEQLATAPVVVDNLEPDQTTTAEALSTTESPGGEGSFECRITELDRMSAE